MTSMADFITGGATKTFNYNPFVFAGTSYVDPKKKLDDQSSHEDTEKNISGWVPEKLTALTSTSVSVKEISKSEDVVPLFQKVEKPSVAYASLIFNRNLSNMLVNLGNLRTNLDKPQGAQDMTYFRDNIKNTWDVKDSLPRSKVLIICALEEAIKDRRWRDLTLGQVGVLEGIVRNLLNNKASLESVFRSIHKSGIDIYPSAEKDNENDTDESDGEE